MDMSLFLSDNYHWLLSLYAFVAVLANSFGA